MTTKETNGLSITTYFNREELKLATIKKIAEHGELDGRTLKQLLIDDLLTEGFLRMETGWILSDLERDGVLTGELKPVGGGMATRHYALYDSSEQTKIRAEDIRNGGAISSTEITADYIIPNNSLSETKIDGDE